MRRAFLFAATLMLLTSRAATGATIVTEIPIDIGTQSFGHVSGVRYGLYAWSGPCVEFSTPVTQPPEARVCADPSDSVAELLAALSAREPFTFWAFGDTDSAHWWDVGEQDFYTHLLLPPYRVVDLALTVRSDNWFLRDGVSLPWGPGHQTYGDYTAHVVTGSIRVTQVPEPALSSLLVVAALVGAVQRRHRRDTH